MRKFERWAYQRPASLGDQQKIQCAVDLAHPSDYHRSGYPTSDRLIFGGESWGGCHVISFEGSFSAWWRGATARESFVHSVVVGPRRTGKTEWFRTLAQHDPPTAVLWNVRLSARRVSTDDVWADLGLLLGIDRLWADPVKRLARYLDDFEDEGPILVVDDWDAAVDTRGLAVPDACYEVLDALARFCLEQAIDRVGRPCLGLALITSLPDAIDLEYFARAVQRPAFERLSKLVTRSFLVEHFPNLTVADSERYLISEGVREEDAAAVAPLAGGWLWLLSELAKARASDGTLNTSAIEFVRDSRLPGLLDEAVLRVVAQRHEVRLSASEPLDYAVREITGGRLPRTFGLPSNYDDETLLAPLVASLLDRTFLVVDTENLRLPFQRHGEVVPSAYPDGHDAFMQRHLGEWLRRLQRSFRVADEDVVLVGRGVHRIDTTVGATMPGKREFVSALTQKDKQKGGNSDDLIAAATIARFAEQHPLAKIVLVSEDGDLPAVMHRAGISNQLIVCTPWQAPNNTRQSVDAQRLVEHGLPIPRPPEVSNERLKAARKGRSSGAH